jgi:hypothetical protein
MIRFFWFCLVAIVICVINIDATIDSETLSQKLIVIKNSNNRRTGDPLPRPVNVGNFSKNQKKLLDSFKTKPNLSPTTDKK